MTSRVDERHVFDVDLLHSIRVTVEADGNAKPLLVLREDGTPMDLKTFSDAVTRLTGAYSRYMHAFERARNGR